MRAGRMEGRRPKHRFPSLALFAVAAMVFAAGCGPLFGESAGPVRRMPLVPGNGQRLQYVASGSSTVAFAGSPWDNDISREVFWSSNSPYLADEQACQTWYTTARSSVSQLGDMPVQPGLALRVAPSGPGGTAVRAITVSERADVSWTAPYHFDLAHFDVDVWDTANTAAPPDSCCLVRFCASRRSDHLRRRWPAGLRDSSALACMCAHVGFDTHRQDLDREQPGTLLGRPCPRCHDGPPRGVRLGWLRGQCGRPAHS